MDDDRSRSSAHPPRDASDIAVESGVSSTSGFGFVTLRWGDQSGQLTPREARLHALSLIEAADAAEHDAVVMRWLTGRMGMPVETAAQVLRDLRIARADLERQQTD